MDAEFTRDAAATAALFGFFAASWFGWAQENPPAAWRQWLIAGAILALLVAIAYHYPQLLYQRSWWAST